MEKKDVYGTLDDFRTWATDHDWMLVIYDPKRLKYVTPLGIAMIVEVDDEEFVVDVYKEAEHGIKG